jgi:hypothetical protein
MSDRILESRIESLEARLRRAERRQAGYLVGCVLTVLLVAILLLREAYLPARVPDTLHIHRLVVLDSSGKERIVIAAPLPEPVVDGQTRHRRTAVAAGIQFKDQDGTERGGIASEEDGSFMFGIDDQRGHERAHLYYIPNRGSGVYLQGDKGGDTLSLLNPAAAGESPELEIIDSSGNRVNRFPGTK